MQATASKKGHSPSLSAGPSQGGPGSGPRGDAGRGRRRGYSWTAAAAALLLPAALAASLLFPAAASASTQHLAAVTGSSACARGGAGLWANLAACGWPGPSNTGPQLAHCPHHRLAPMGGGLSSVIVIRTPGAVISCRRVTGMVYIEARNVTVKNSSIISSSGRAGVAANGTADITVADGASATVDHVAINGDDGVHACIWHQGTRLTVNAINCHGIDDGIFSWPDTSYSWTTGNNFTIRNSYFHGFTHATSNGHEDGYQTEGASNGLIEHNTYLMTPSADSAIAIWDSRRSSSNITVAGNLITGGGFAVYAEDYSPSDTSPAGGYSVTHIRFLHNVFSTYASGCIGLYGVWFTRPSWAGHGGPTDGWHRNGNRVIETGQNIDGHNPTRNGVLCQ
jgi:hypothetical protein